MDYLKAERLTSTKWRLLGIPFGGPFDGKDMDDERFSIKTDIKPDWFDRRPAVWHHNLDKTMDADSTIGTTDDLELEEKLGWWTTVWLNRSHQYWGAVDALLQAGKIFGSSGTLPNFVKVDKKTGEILVWPYVEQTLTPIPSNFLSRLVPAKAAEHFDEAGILFVPNDPSVDLRPDLPPGGDDVARRRVLGIANAELARFKNL